MDCTQRPTQFLVYNVESPDSPPLERDSKCVFFSRSFELQGYLAETNKKQSLDIVLVWGHRVGRFLVSELPLSIVSMLERTTSS
jgi:hypothetical protein